MRRFLKVALGFLVVYLLGCAAVKSYDIEESFGTAAKAYKAIVEEEQKGRLPR